MVSIVATDSAITDLIMQFLAENSHKSVFTKEEIELYNPVDKQVWDYALSDRDHFYSLFFESAPFGVRIVGLEHIVLKSLSVEKHLDRVVEIKGHVIAVSDTEPVIFKLYYNCNSCDMLNCFGEEEKRKCTRCNSNKLTKTESGQQYIDRQVIKIAEITNEGNPASLAVVMTGTKIMWKVKAGQTVIITGKLKVKHKAEKLIKYFQCLALSKEQEDADFTLSDFDVSRFDTDRLALSEEEYWKMLTRSFAPHIEGYDEVKQSLLLALVSTDAHPFNILLVGDPSVAKSSLLLYIAGLHQNGHYVSFATASTSSLLAHAQKDDELNSWIIIPGLLAQADRGIACADEMQAINEDTAKKLNEALYNRTISYAKGGHVGKLPARCACIFASNSYYGSWNTKKTIADNLQFLGRVKETTITRFPLIFIMRDHKDESRDRRIAKKIIEKIEISEQKEDFTIDGITHYGFKTLRKFISYVVAKPLPAISAEIKQYIEDWYIEKRNRQGEDENDDKNYSLIKSRFLEYACQIAILRARLLSKPQVSKVDFDIISEILKKSMDVAAFDPTTNKVDSNNIEGSKSKSEIEQKESKLEELMSIFDAQSSVTIQEWCDYLVEVKEWSRINAMQQIRKVSDAGLVVLRGSGKYERS